MPTRVLVVDDHDIVRRTLVRTLQRLGYEPVEACTGETALELIEDRVDAFDCMVIDRIMPGLSGPELIQRIRQQAPDVPIVLTTGYQDVAPPTVETISCILAKPWTAGDVRAAMQKALGQDPGPSGDQCGPPSGGSN